MEILLPDEIGKESNKRFTQLKTVDFPEPHIANNYRILGGSEDDNEITIEFGYQRDEDLSAITIVSSVRIDKKLAFMLSSSIKDKVSFQMADMYTEIKSN